MGLRSFLIYVRDYFNEEWILCTSREKEILDSPSVHGNTKSRSVFPQLYAQIKEAGADAQVNICIQTQYDRRKGQRRELIEFPRLGSLETRMIGVRYAGFVICRRREHAIRIYSVHIANSESRVQMRNE